MGLAETAVLAVQLALNGGTQFKAGIAEADAAAASLGTTATATGRAVASTGNFMGTTATKTQLLKQAVVSTGQAVQGMGNHFQKVLSGPLGLIAAGGIFVGLGKVIHDSITEAATFGLNVANVAKITNLTTAQASAMVDTLDKWGVSSDRLIPLLGRMEKNLGTLGVANAKGVQTVKEWNKHHDKALTTTQKLALEYPKLAEFQKQYGVALTDSKGKILDANALLLKSADYFNSTAKASDKATFLSKIYGKAWQDLIPVLSKGSAFIKAQEADSIKLTDTQLANITKYRDAQRDFADTFGDVQVKIGAEIMPTLTMGLKNASAWFDANGDKIASTFGDIARFAGDAVQTMGDVFSAIRTGWEQIPAPIRDILVKGIIADRTIHFLFGVSPLNLAKNLIGDLIGPILGRLGGGFLQKGGSPANPLWVQSVSGGLGGGLPGGGAGGFFTSGLLGPLSLIIGSGIASYVAATDYANQHIAPLQAQGLTRAEILAQQYYTGDRATQQEILKHTGQLPTKADYDSGNAKLTATLDRRAEDPASPLPLRHFRPTDRNTARSYIESHRGERSDALVAAEVRALQHAATGIQKVAASRDKETSLIVAAAAKASRAAGILSAGAQRDAETSGAIKGLSGPFVPSVKLDASQITDLRKTAKSTDIEAMRGRIGNALAAAQRATQTSGSSIVGAIRANRPITNVQVNVSATSVSHTTTVVTRYGPTGGTRNTSSNYSTNPGK